MKSTYIRGWGRTALPRLTLIAGVAVLAACDTDALLQVDAAPKRKTVEETRRLLREALSHAYSSQGPRLTVIKVDTGVSPITDPLRTRCV